MELLLNFILLSICVTIIFITDMIELYELQSTQERPEYLYYNIITRNFIIIQAIDKDLNYIDEHTSFLINKPVNNKYYENIGKDITSVTIYIGLL